LSRNLTDICLGTLWQTPTRSKIIGFSHAYDQADFRLLVRTVEASVNYLEQTFIPFEYELWGLLIGVTMILAVVLWVVERGELGSAGCFQSWWLSVQGLLTGGIAHAPQTVAGKIISTGYTFLILIVLAGYTANLAAFRTVSMKSSEFESMMDIVDKGKSVCVTRVVTPAVRAQYPNINLIQYANDDKTLDGFVASGVKEGCQGSLLNQKQFEATQTGELCKLEFVGPTAYTVPVALGVRAHVPWSYELDHYVDHYRFNGKLAEWLTADRKTSNCPAVDESDDDTPRLDIKQMIGGLAFCAIFCGLGCLVFGVQKLREMLGRREMDQAQDESSQAEQGMRRDEADKFESLQKQIEQVAQEMQMLRSVLNDSICSASKNDPNATMQSQTSLTEIQERLPDSCHFVVVDI